MVQLMELVEREERIEALRQWLAQKPFDWGPALATRAAFRTIPWLLSQPSDIWLREFGSQIFHALFVAWSSASMPIKGHKYAAELSSNLLYPAAMHHESVAYFASGMRQIDMAFAAKKKPVKIDHSMRAIVALENLTKAKVATVPIQEDFFWLSVQEDVDLISRYSDNKGAKKLLRFPFVDNLYAAAWTKYLEVGLYNLIQINPDFDLWKKWVEDVIEFRRYNFFEGDSRTDAHARDRQVSSAIIQKIDADFWVRRAGEVNSDIRNWMSEEVGDSSLENEGLGQLPPQNTNAISFRSNALGKIELSEIRHSDIPGDDHDALDRYDECVSNASELRSSCERSNSAGRIIALLDRYLSSAGGNIRIYDQVFLFSAGSGFVKRLRRTRPMTACSRRCLTIFCSISRLGKRHTTCLWVWILP